MENTPRLKNASALLNYFQNLSPGRFFWRFSTQTLQGSVFLKRYSGIMRKGIFFLPWQMSSNTDNLWFIAVGMEILAGIALVFHLGSLEKRIFSSSPSEAITGDSLRREGA